MMASKPFSLKITDTHKNIFIGIVAGILFLVAGYAITIKPFLVKVQKIKLEALSASERSKIIPEIHKLKEKKTKLEKSMSTEKEKHMILGRINTVGDESGLEINSLVPNTEVNGSYTALLLQLKGRSRFATLIKFLEALEKARPDISIDYFTIMNSAYAGAGSIPNIELTLKTLLKKENK